MKSILNKKTTYVVLGILSIVCPSSAMAAGGVIGGGGPGGGKRSPCELCMKSFPENYRDPNCIPNGTSVAFGGAFGSPWGYQELPAPAVCYSLNEVTSTLMGYLEKVNPTTSCVASIDFGPTVCGNAGPAIGNGGWWASGTVTGGTYSNQ